MALGCIGGTGECDGCGACMADGAYICAVCGTRIGTGSPYYKPGDTVLCPACVHSYDGALIPLCSVCGETAENTERKMFEAGNKPICGLCLESAKRYADCL